MGHFHKRVPVFFTSGARYLPNFVTKILGYRDPRCKHENSNIITRVIRIEMSWDEVYSQS